MDSEDDRCPDGICLYSGDADDDAWNKIQCEKCKNVSTPHPGAPLYNWTATYQNFQKIEFFGRARNFRFSHSWRFFFVEEKIFLSWAKFFSHVLIWVYDIPYIVFGKIRICRWFLGWFWIVFF